jgi:uncharacterized protein YdhG (YjbR/CyaY superfamily)
MPMSERRKPPGIDDYIASAPADVRPVLERIRQVVHARVPGATETIGYKMPAFRLGKIFIYFAAFKKHIGIYPPVRGDQALLEALRDYRGEKGNLKFPLDQPMPFALIGRVAEALARERTAGS